MISAVMRLFSVLLRVFSFITGRFPIILRM